MSIPAGREESELELMLEAARVAGDLVMRRFGAEQVVTLKTPDQPLTVADLEADEALKHVLCGARPEYGWLSEETADRPDRLERRRVWIVDPIDGTRSYIAGLREFSISVGLAQDGVAVLGVVYNPAADELYWAVRGEGAYAAAPGSGRRVRLTVSPRAAFAGATALASRSEIAAGEFDPFTDWRIQPTGSTALKLARLAASAGDVFLSRGPKSEWDVCAGALLVQEAGGRATDLNGGDLRYNRSDPYVHGVLASNEALHASVLERLRLLPPPPRLTHRIPDPLHPGLEVE